MQDRSRSFAAHLATILSLTLASLIVQAWPLPGQGAQGQQASPDRGALRVASYNIHHGAGSDKCTPPPASRPPAADCGLNLERIARIVRDMDADVVGLQEVDRFWGRSGYVDQAMRLGELLSMNVCFGGNLDHQADVHADRPHQYGTLILSKRPLLACWNTLLPRASETAEQRGLLRAVVELDNGARLHVFNMHLHTTVPDRALQVPVVDTLIGDSSPAILLGDFNAQPTEASMSPLQARFQDAWLAVGSTEGSTDPAKPDALPRRRIDYAFTTRDITVTEANFVITQDSRVASDHLPLITSIRVAAPVNVAPAATPQRAR